MRSYVIASSGLHLAVLAAAVFLLRPGGFKKPGDVYRIPGNVRHKVIVLESPARAIDIFYPVREEYR